MTCFFLLPLHNIPLHISITITVCRRWDAYACPGLRTGGCFYGNYDRATMLLVVCTPPACGVEEYRELWHFSYFLKSILKLKFNYITFPLPFLLSNPYPFFFSVPVLGRFYYYCSAVQLEIRHGDTSRRAVVVQDCFSNFATPILIALYFLIINWWPLNCIYVYVYMYTNI